MSDNYVETTRSVLDSAKLLLNEIQVGSGNLQPAIEDLAKTAQLHEEQGVGAQALRFSALDTDADKTTKQQMTEEILANALSDVQVANVLMTAGWAVGELDEAPNVPQFQQAVLGLEETLETVKEVTGDSGGSGPAYFAPPQNGGTEMPAADRFADRVASTLSSFVGDAQSVLKYVVESLKKLDMKAVSEAIGRLGEQLPQFEGVRSLFRRGVDLLKRAINALVQFFDHSALSGVKKHIQELWEKLKESGVSKPLLEWAFMANETRDMVKAKAVDLQGLEAARLDSACAELESLSASFSKNMAVAKGLVSGVAVASGLLAFTSLAAGPALPLVAASLYVLILAGVVLLGRDYADSGLVLRRVKGVGAIVKGVLA